MTRQRLKKRRKRKRTKRKNEKPKEYIRIDFDGLSDRVARVPIEGDNYEGLVVTKEYLIYTRAGTPFYDAIVILRRIWSSIH